MSNQPVDRQQCDRLFGRLKTRNALLAIWGFVAVLLLVTWLVFHKAQNHVLEEISQLGGIVTHDQSAVYFNSARLGDAELEQLAPGLAGMSNLKVVIFDGASITDASVPCLQRLRTKRGVIISCGKTLLSDSGRQQIQGITISTEDAKRLLQADGDETAAQIERLTRDRAKEKRN
jgi:hypothetical protein